MQVKKLMYNSVLCTQCGETLVSHSRHDYKTCKCENETMVDGGTDYQRFGGKDLSKVQSFCLYDDSPHELLREYVCRGGRGKNGNEPLKYVKLKDIDDEWLRAIIDYEEQCRPNNKYLPIYYRELNYRLQKENSKCTCNSGTLEQAVCINFTGKCSLAND